MIVYVLTYLILASQTLVALINHLRATHNTAQLAPILKKN